MRRRLYTHRQLARLCSDAMGKHLSCSRVRENHVRWKAYRGDHRRWFALALALEVKEAITTIREYF